MDIEGLKREVRILRAVVAATVGLCGIALAGVASGAWPRQNFDEITVHRINVVDRENKLAMVLASHDDEATPIALGHPAVRQQGNNADNGIIFFNQKGDEQGGLVWNASHDRNASGDTLSFDSAKTDQLLQVVDAAENDKHAAYLIGWDRAPNDLQLAVEMVSELQRASTDAQRQAIVARYKALGWGARRRFFVGYGPDGVSQVTLYDGSARPRMEMSVTAQGAAKLAFLDANGHVTYQLPPQ
ncbi:MAG TPA: hypothetical protein VMH02_02730 [Verrucomicrobiae bacterium]|nr:hypothetical protein [Verrucomicrobiae bacterium]